MRFSVLDRFYNSRRHYNGLPHHEPFKMVDITILSIVGANFEMKRVRRTRSHGSV